MLERYEVEAFLTLAEELHFGRTAERLHVSTARISQTIARLERRIGVPLFHRTSRRVRLSSAGLELYGEVRPAWERIGAAVVRAVEAGRGLSGRLRVAFVGPAAGQLLAGIAQEFRERHPDCEVRLREAQLPEVMPWLREGAVELALTCQSVLGEDVAVGPVLVREARMLAVPAGHPFARRGAVSPAELGGLTVLRLPGTPSAFEDRTPTGGLGGLGPGGPLGPLGPEATTFNEALTLVGAGEGVFEVGAHARRYFARPDVAYVTLTDAEPVEWSLVWPADGATARVRAFGEAALAVIGPAEVGD
ncbi:LysR family transcriptional regulator [Kitasatospora sp. NPDC051170]|uniref:LysR family transcriptional regulator n=1 Tax=Kitasatospora sp. NPDC051170 TaxID=3364056 RepID=UPI0037899797